MSIPSPSSYFLSPLSPPPHTRNIFRLSAMLDEEIEMICLLWHRCIPFPALSLDVSSSVFTVFLLDLNVFLLLFVPSAATKHVLNGCIWSLLVIREFLLCFERMWRLSQFMMNCVARREEPLSFLFFKHLFITSFCRFFLLYSLLQRLHCRCKARFKLSSIIGPHQFSSAGEFRGDTHRSAFAEDMWRDTDLIY